MRHSAPVLTLAAMLCLSPVLLAADWPQFRGPSGDGVCRETGFPHEWGPQQNVQWKTKLPAPGNSSPIVSNGRVFLTVASEGGKKRSLYCFDRQGGEELWVQTVEFAAEDPTHKTNPYCGSTPAADGERVVVWHGSAGLYCYDFSGKQLWKRDLGEYRHMWGYGSSPILHQGRVILNCGPGRRVSMLALQVGDGAEVWRTMEPQDGDGEKNTAGKYMGSWATPLIVKASGREQLVCTMPTRVNGYDPATGEILWSCEGIRGPRGDLAYSSPLVGGDFCVAIGGFRGPAVGFPLKGSGDITPSRVWRKEENPQSIGSGVFLGEYCYLPNAGPGVIQCIEARSGEVVWQDRAAGGNYWGSIVAADGLLFVTNQAGATVVFHPDPEKFRSVAINKLGEPSNSTPAFSDGQIFLRTDEHLYCIGR